MRMKTLSVYSCMQTPAGHPAADLPLLPHFRPPTENAR